MREGRVSAFDEIEGIGRIRETRGSREFEFTQKQQREWLLRRGRVVFNRRKNKRLPLIDDLVLFSTSNSKLVSWSFDAELSPDMLEILEYQRREKLTNEAYGATATEAIA
jgi:hypothetical protein